MCKRGAKIYPVKHFQIHGTAVDRQVVAKAFSNKMLLNWPGGGIPAPQRQGRILSKTAPE